MDDLCVHALSHCLLCMPPMTPTPPGEARAVPADPETAANGERLYSLDDLVMDVDAQIDTILRRVADRHYANKSSLDDDWLAWACNELRHTRQQLAAAAGSEVREEWGEAEIRAAYAKHATRDDWGIKSFYEDGLLNALRGKYDSEA